MPATLIREACETLTALPTRTHPKLPYLPQPFPPYPQPTLNPPTFPPPGPLLLQPFDDEQDRSDGREPELSHVGVETCKLTYPTASKPSTSHSNQAFSVVSPLKTMECSPGCSESSFIKVSLLSRQTMIILNAPRYSGAKVAAVPPRRD
jgi:hypothetical protein